MIGISSTLSLNLENDGCSSGLPSFSYGHIGDFDNFGGMAKGNKYIRRLIREGEGQHLDFKYAINDSRKIARSLVAFANSEGGTLLIGVKDNGRIAGVRSDEEIYMIETAAITFCRPPVRYSTHIHEIEGLTVVEVHVPPAPRRPHRAPDDHGRWHAYVRVNDQNRLANSILVRSWKRKTSRRGTWVHYSRAEQFLLEYLAEHDHISRSAFRRLASIPDSRAASILVNFLAWEVIVPVFTDQGILYSLRNEEGK